MFDDLITHHTPPPNRATYCEGGVERHLSEGAVMLAFAMHLLRTWAGLKQVGIHPDGEHAKRFAFRPWLELHGFTKTRSSGTTAYAGTYVSKEGHVIVLNPKSGLSDVIATLGDRSIVAECKGGIINTKHPGQQSRLRRGLCETVGLSLAIPIVEGRRQYAVVPKTPVTETMAKKLAPRASSAGITIALVDNAGNVFDMP
jgi:hypothetical protein